MIDTLRSTVERMRCDYSYESLRYDSTGFWEHDPTKCPKCRLEALRAEYEKVDLVKKWKQAANDMREAATRERAYAERFYDERAEHLRNSADFEGTANLYDAFAAELETWLAVT